MHSHLKTYTYQDTPEGRERVRRAAEIAGVPIAAFLRAAAASAANRVLRNANPYAFGEPETKKAESSGKANRREHTGSTAKRVHEHRTE